MAQVRKKSLVETYTQSRGWGVEKWIENGAEYCGKLLLLNPNKRCSLHFHVKKLETMYLQKGLVTILFVNTDSGKEYSEQLEPGDSIQIPRYQPHQIIAGPEGAELFEFSTEHEEEDSYRIRKGD